MRTGSLGVLVLLCASFAIAIGDETATLTVKNLTPHIVTIVVADKTFPAVASGAAVTYTATAPDTVGVDVSYAPGQGVSGSAQRTFQLLYFRGATGYGTTSYFACVVNGGITSPAIGGPVLWNVTADTLATR
jgi:hypothetical protein